MDKLHVLFVIALFSNAAFGQDSNQGQSNGNSEDLDNRFNIPFWFPGQNGFPGQNQFPGPNQFPGQNVFPGPNQFPGQNVFPGPNQFPGQNVFPGPNRPRPRPAPTTTSTTTAAPGVSTTTTMSPEVRSCISTCPVTSEYNPVCGTDRVTYNNPGRLSCAQLCGVNVSLLRMSPCPTAQPAAAN